MPSEGRAEIYRVMKNLMTCQRAPKPVVNLHFAQRTDLSDGVEYHIPSRENQADFNLIGTHYNMTNASHSARLATLFTERLSPCGVKRGVEFGKKYDFTCSMSDGGVKVVVKPRIGK